MSFNQGSFASRFGLMGDAAERVFETVFPRHSRMGLNRPDMSVARMPTLSRCVPDYQCEDALVEVMGIGRDQTLKMKIEKAHALLVWETIDRVDLFVSDSHRRRYWRAPLQQWLEACIEHADTDRFHDNRKLYWRLHADNFPVDPTPTPRDDGAN